MTEFSFRGEHNFKTSCSMTKLIGKNSTYEICVTVKLLKNSWLSNVATFSYPQLHLNEKTNNMVRFLKPRLDNTSSESWTPPGKLPISFSTKIKLLRLFSQKLLIWLNNMLIKISAALVLNHQCECSRSICTHKIWLKRTVNGLYVISFLSVPKLLARLIWQVI